MQQEILKFGCPLPLASVARARQNKGKYKCIACKKNYPRPLMMEDKKGKICPHCGYVHTGILSEKK